MSRTFLNHCLRGILCAWLLTAVISHGAEKPTAALPEGWSFRSPREEIQPAFDFEPNVGQKQTGSMVIRHDGREALDGWFQKTIPVKGGEWYQFHVERKLTNVKNPRRSALVRIAWQNDQGQRVPADIPAKQLAELDHVPNSPIEHPGDGETNGEGWTTVAGVYQAPSKATQAVVELHLQWAPNGTAAWSNFTFTPTTAPPPRLVRLATVHYMPSGKSPQANCEEYAPFVAKAAEQKADLVVLGETIPYVRVQKGPHEVSEPIPGPTTEYFGQLAQKNRLHIVLSLYERSAEKVFNTAILLDPDGKLIGKYRKVCLPHGEVERGVAAGDEYPVFQTRFGKVGMMICYDGFFPEVARALSNNGAEVIAWPVWGCNPLLAQARACENHVYLISSTFTDAKKNWMISAVYDQTGKAVAQADTWGSVAVTEVDLSRPYIGPNNLGDFRAMVSRHRPAEAGEK